MPFGERLITGIKVSTVNSDRAVINSKFITAFCHTKKEFQNRNERENVEDMD